MKPQTSRSKINKKVQGDQNLPLKTPERDTVESKLHDYAPKKITTHSAVVVETATVKGFHPDP
jgi:hypothetical protein